MFNRVLKKPLLCLTESFQKSMVTHCVRVFYKEPSCKGSNVRNGLKFKQPVKQHSRTLSKKFYFFNFKFTDDKFVHNCFWLKNHN